MKAAETPRVPLRGAPIWPLSVAAYHALGETGLIPKNTELLYGFVYQKMPKSPFHCLLINRLIRLLLAVLPAEYLLRSEQPITCEDSEPESDVSIVSGSENEFSHEHPKTAQLVVEVCVNSHDYDRSKLRAYAGAGVKEVWLVLAPEQQIEVCQQPSNGEFANRRIHGPGGRLASASLPAFSLDLAAFFAK